MLTKELDIVYILGNGSRWQNNEIRFSLRSVEKNLDHKDIFIIGEKPFWIRDVKHIPAKDLFQNKLKNALHKLKIACKKVGTEHFVLMNDDFFILRKTTMVQHCNKGLLIDSIKNHPTKKGYYYDSLVDTYEFLLSLKIENPKDFSLHTPIVYNKKDLLNVISVVEVQEKALLLRTVYCNMLGIRGGLQSDVKITCLQDLKDEFFLKSRFISTTDQIVRRKEFVNFIRDKFETPSKYEQKIIYGI